MNCILLHSKLKSIKHFGNENSKIKNLCVLNSMINYYMLPNRNCENISITGEIEEQMLSKWKAEHWNSSLFTLEIQWNCRKSWKW